jgi:hypothetical protein
MEREILRARSRAASPWTRMPATRLTGLCVSTTRVRNQRPTILPFAGFEPIRRMLIGYARVSTVEPRLHLRRAQSRRLRAVLYRHRLATRLRRGASRSARLSARV